MSLEKSDSAQQWVKWLLIIPLVFALSAVIFYSATFSHLPHNQDPDAWGTFGDFLGGLLNPVVSTLTLFVAIQVWQLQKIELKATQQALQELAKTAEQQRGEQRFFDLLNLYLKTLDSITFAVPQHSPLKGQLPDRLESGRRALDAWYDKHAKGLTPFAIEHTVNEIDLLTRHWKSLFLSDFVPSYMRVVFRLLSDAEHLFEVEEDRYRYMKLFRAQLSPTELNLLGLNLWVSETGKKMRGVANEYGLLKHMQDGPLRNRLINELADEWPKLFGKKTIANQAQGLSKKSITSDPQPHRAE